MFYQLIFKVQFDENCSSYFLLSDGFINGYCFFLIHWIEYGR